MSNPADIERRLMREQLRAERAQAAPPLEHPAPQLAETVCVTGANGFFASHLVAALLERGLTVHGTVRDLNPSKTCHLTSLPGAADHLKLYQAELLVEGAFDECLRGCTGLFHTASPFFVGGPNTSSANAGGEDYNEQNLLTPAINGTLNVLRSAVAAGVQHAVVTASTACVYVDYGARGASHIYTEADWSPSEGLRERASWYALSKTLAEQAAFEFAASADLPLATVQPPLILGPMINPVLNTSSAALLNLLQGKSSKVRNECKAMVDVRDVVLAHVLAYEHRSVGRHLCIGACPHWTEVCDILRADQPDCNAPTELDPEVPPPGMGAPPPHPTLYSNAKLEGLGMRFTDLATTITDTVSSLKQHGLY